MSRHRAVAHAAAWLTALTLAACATGSDTPAGVTWADGAESGVVTGGVLADATVTRVTYRDSWQRETYARIAWPGGRGELVYIEANRTDQKALDMALTPDRAIRAFVATRAQVASDRPEGRTAAWGSPVFYQRYVDGGAAPDCIGFAAQWAKPADDPKRRPGRAAFGYFCPADAAWSDDEISLLLRSIGLERAQWVPVPDTAPTEPAALAFARGQDGKAQGQPDFPRRAARAPTSSATAAQSAEIRCRRQFYCAAHALPYNPPDSGAGPRRARPKTMGGSRENPRYGNPTARSKQGDFSMKRRSFLTGAGAAVAGAGVATAATSSFPKPAVAQDRVELAMVTTWPRDFPGLGTGAQRLAQRLSDMSDGRIQVQYFAAGERVGAFDSFDEVASGNAQAYHAADYYWKGKHPGWAYYTAVPFGLTYTEINAWIRFGGGQELWDELAGDFGLKCIMAGNTGVQMGGWFNKEIETADDLKGLKMRIPGLGGDVMAKLGASPVSLPGGQIYENLVSGAIDATEWVGPWNDEIMKFYEAAKFYYYPGMHEPGSTLSMGMNASWWGSLTKSDQVLIEAAAGMENDVMMSEYNAKNGDALARLIDDQGVELREFNDEIYDSFGEAADEVFEEARAHSDLASRIHESFLKTRANVGGWAKISDVAFITQRNRVLGV